MVRFPAWFKIKSYDFCFLQISACKNIKTMYKKNKNIEKDKTLNTQKYILQVAPPSK